MITVEQAFTLAATYGFPVELTIELAEERGQAVDLDGFQIEMARQSRGLTPLQARASYSARPTSRGAPTSPPSSSATRRRTSSPSSGRSRSSRRASSSRSSASPLLPRRRGPGHGPGTVELDDGSGTRAELVEAHRLEGDQALLLRGRASPRATAYVRSSRGASASRRWRTTRARTSCTASSGTCSATTCGRRAGGAAGQAPLRLHARARAHVRGAGGGRAPGERAGLRGAPGARLRDADRGGAQARGDDAVRREVRGHRSCRRGPGTPSSSAAEPMSRRQRRSARS